MNSQIWGPFYFVTHTLYGTLCTFKLNTDILASYFSHFCQFLKIILRCVNATNALRFSVEESLLSRKEKEESQHEHTHTKSQNCRVLLVHYYWIDDDL